MSHLLDEEEKTDESCNLWQFGRWFNYSMNKTRRFFCTTKPAGVTEIPPPLSHERQRDIDSTSSSERDTVNNSVISGHKSETEHSIMNNNSSNDRIPFDQPLNISFIEPTHLEGAILTASDAEPSTVHRTRNDTLTETNIVSEAGSKTITNVTKSLNSEDSFNQNNINHPSPDDSDVDNGNSYSGHSATSSSFSFSNRENGPEFDPKGKIDAYVDFNPIFTKLARLSSEDLKSITISSQPD